jgi:hypothetical protein
MPLMSPPGRTSIVLQDFYSSVLTEPLPSFPYNIPVGIPVWALRVIQVSLLFISVPDLY